MFGRAKWSAHTFLSLSNHKQTSGALTHRRSVRPAETSRRLGHTEASRGHFSTFARSLPVFRLLWESTPLANPMTVFRLFLLYGTSAVNIVTNKSNRALSLTLDPLVNKESWARLRSCFPQPPHCQSVQHLTQIDLDPREEVGSQDKLRSIHWSVSSWPPDTSLS